MSQNETLKILRKALKGQSVYYMSKTEEFRVLATHCTDEPSKRKAISEILNTVSNAGIRPRYRIDNKVYQGFIYNTYVVFNLKQGN